MKFRHSELTLTIENYQELGAAKDHSEKISVEDLKASILRLRKSVDCVLSVVEAQGIEMSTPSAPTAIPTYGAIGEFERISVPIAFIEKIFAYTKEKIDVRDGSSIADLALLTIYLHELSHAFMQHLTHEESSAQEIYADFLAGALLEKLSNNSRLQSIIGSTISDVKSKRLALVCLVCSMPKEPGGSLYLPRFMRLAIMLRGCDFALNPHCTNAYSEDPVVAVSGAPALVQDLKMISADVSDDDLVRMEDLIRGVDAEKVDWFRESKRLRPIAKKLREAQQKP